MKFTIATALLALLLVAAASAANAQLTAGAAPLYPSAVPTDFSANISIDQGGVKLKGFIVADLTGLREYRYIKELNQTTYTFQKPGLALTFQFTIMSSGCTCQKTPNGLVTSLFSQAATATKSSKPCKGASGTLYTNDEFPGLPATHTFNYCFNGNVPVYVQEGDKYITLTNFQAGRKVAFPLHPMDKWVDNCASQCF